MPAQRVSCGLPARLDHLSRWRAGCALSFGDVCAQAISGRLLRSCWIFRIPFMIGISSMVPVSRPSAAVRNASRFRRAAHCGNLRIGGRFGNAGEAQQTDAIEEITRRLIEYYRPVRIYLFGSTARGDAGPDSDLDFCVVPRPALRLLASQLPQFCCSHRSFALFPLLSTKVPSSPKILMHTC